MRKIVIGIIFFLCLAPHAYAATIGRPMNNLGLVEYWPLDGATTNWSTNQTSDVSGNGNTGSMFNFSTSTSPVLGKIGQALKFDGSSQYINAGNGSYLTKWSASAWVKVGSYAGYGTIVIRGAPTVRNYELLINKTTGTAAAAFTDSASSFRFVNSNAVIPLNTWTHITGTFDGTTLSIYINGVLDNSATLAFTPQNINGVGIGTYGSGSPGDYFNGAIDDVRVYSRSLSATEVKALYSSEAAHLGTGSNSLKTNLLAYWKLDETSGHTFTDATGNGYNGVTSLGQTWGTGKINNGMVLNGSNYATTSLKTALGDFTACAWFYSLGTVSGYDRIIDKEYTQGFWIGRNSTTANTWGGGIEQASAPYGIYVTLSDNAWHFICMVRSGTTETINGDGGAVTNSQTVSSALTSASPVWIGQAQPNTGFFKGTIDEVGIWSRALSSSEIATLYNSGKGKQYPFVSQTIIGHSNAASGGSGLVGYWTMDGSKTNWATGQETDASGNGNTASLISMSTSTQPTQGKIGQALKFDGSSQYLNLPTLTQTSAGTVSMWINPGSTINSSKNVGIFDAGTPNSGEMLMRWSDGTGQMYFYVDSGSYKSVATNTATWAGGRWYLVTGTWDGTNIKIYVNGVLENTTAQGSPNFGTGNWRIGASSSGSTVYYWNGAIDDARIYNRALSATEVQALYNATR